ncbi:hypothetical protein ACWFQ8_17190 [Streptomyces sp. NPDC055254]
MVFLVVVFLGAAAAVVLFAAVAVVGVDLLAVGLRGDGFLGAAFFVAAFQPVAQPMQLRSSRSLFVPHWVQFQLPDGRAGDGLRTGAPTRSVSHA